MLHVVNLIIDLNRLPKSLFDMVFLGEQKEKENGTRVYSTSNSVIPRNESPFILSNDNNIQ